jgi:plastocyanin domain-containing protein
MWKKAIVVTITLLVATITLSAAAFANVQNCCMTKKHSSKKQEPPAEAAQQNDAQTATIEVTGKGFEPSSLKLKAGVPARVTFVRKTDETCAKEVVIKEYNINRKLPLNEPVTVEFTPRKGEFTFACGMNMLKGKLIVE